MVLFLQWCYLYSSLFFSESITHIEITRDDQCYLAACADSTLRLMDKSSGELLSE